MEHFVWYTGNSQCCPIGWVAGHFYGGPFPTKKAAKDAALKAGILLWGQPAGFPPEVIFYYRMVEIVPASEVRSAHFKTRRQPELLRRSQLEAGESAMPPLPLHQERIQSARIRKMLSS